MIPPRGNGNVLKQSQDQTATGKNTKIIKLHGFLDKRQNLRYNVDIAVVMFKKEAKTS